jgi:anti-sigma-K factor RskA
MSNPENLSRLEELAALHAVDLLDEAGLKELFDAADRDADAARLRRDFSETGALLALDAPEKTPPPQLRREILSQLPARRASSKIIAFPAWIPYAVAACLMILGIAQLKQIMALKTQLRTASANVDRLSKSNAFAGLCLSTLDAKDTAYTAVKVLVAWDPNQNQGSVSLANLPPAPAGHDYQLWVLDPGAPAPVSAGVITGSRRFAVSSVSVTDPGFAVSLEPTGGSPQPTGPILFAVAPGT